jgi:hypothetical protein
MENLQIIISQSVVSAFYIVLSLISLTILASGLNNKTARKIDSFFGWSKSANSFLKRQQQKA